MNEVKGQEVRTSNMGPGADARYLTYGRLNGRLSIIKISITVSGNVILTALQGW